MKRMMVKNILLVILCVGCWFQSGNAQQSWSHSPGEIKGFIQNNGQFKMNPIENFNSEILFSHDGSNEDFYFTKSGVVFEYNIRQKRIKSEEEKAARKQRKTLPFTSEEWTDFENEGHRVAFETDILCAQWLNANPNVEIVAEDKNSFYHSYTFKNFAGIEENKCFIPSFKKVTYKNLYPNIDVVYELHPQSGIKYSVIVYPGGDVSQVKLKYSKDIVLASDGTIHTKTVFGDVIDHAPITFYEDNKGVLINSAYLVSGNTISFKLDNYDVNRTIVIDPWTQSPTFATNWDCVWECEKDAAGNVYIIGGVTPLQLIKYNSAGALQWTYNTPYDTTEWLGTFATDNLGNSYVANGSTARIQKVNTAGVMQWNNNSPGGLFSSMEFWNITFNCDQTQLVIGGTGGTLPPLPFIYNINMNTGAVTSQLQVHDGQLIPTQEIRSITACGNGKYYFLTHDSIGYVHQSLTSCLTNGQPFHVDNNISFGYKCENYRYNNSGIMALKYYGGFIFVHKGNELQKRDFATANVIATVAIPGGSLNGGFGGNNVGCSGIDIDNCGNIFVGSTTGVVQFNQALTQVATFPTAFRVYDVAVSTAGDVIAAGSTGNSGNNTRTGSVQSFAAAACAPQTTICCDASVCNIPPVCSNAAPFNISPTTPGGTFTGIGITNGALGTFDPSIAGPGVHTLTYTLPCGSETLTITVNFCAPITACVEANGDITATGGDGGPYTWENGTMVPSCVAGFSNFCGLFTAAGPLVQQWSTITTGAFTVNTTASQDTLQITDGNGNTLVITNIGTLPACTALPCSATNSQTNVSCFGGNNGTATANATGGSGTYTYSWNTVPVQTTATATGLTAGSYTCTISDGAGCTTTTTVTITQPTAITVTQTANTPATCGLQNGSATVSASGGTGAITFSWNSTPVQTGATATGLAAGNYIVTATDASGCVQTLNITITSSGGATATITAQTNVSCNGGTNGSATVTASGGTAGYTYSWSPSGGTGATASGLAAGTYTVTVTDGSGCTSTANATITQPNAIAITTSSTNATCGLSDGTVTANGTGGTGAITYSWNTVPVQTTATATGVPAGTYTVTATDANGCTQTANVSVSNTGAPTISIQSQTNVLCNGAANGTATVTTSGGSGALTITWNTSPAQTGATANGLSGGTYIATVTDAAGCSASVNVTITEPNAVSGIASTTNANCSAADGTATVVASGGDGNYTYVWSPSGGTGATASGLAAGAYTVTITDGNGCVGTANATVSTVNTAAIDAGADVYVTLGSSTILTASGGVSYVWNADPTLSCTACASPTATPTMTTAYIVTGTDAAGCIGTDTVFVIVDLPCGKVFLPNAFSPNGDLQNDELCVLGNCIVTLQFQLFDRWGEKVFETENPQICWDGTLNGKPMNPAVFYYYLSAVTSNGETVTLKGNISLIR